MKKLHILNIGYPKCGTTWLWNALLKNQSIQGHYNKENHGLCNGITVNEYCRQYSEDITANFCPNNMILDRYVIEELSRRPQLSASIILREPISLIWSLYTYRNVQNIDFITYCYQLHDSKWFTNMNVVIERWKEHFSNRFHIFWYDELKNNNLEFYNNYCKTMGLDPGNSEMIQLLNTTKYVSSMPVIDEDLAKLLNQEFEKVKNNECRH